MDIFGIPWQDFVLSIGGLIGTYSKIIALYDTNTIWTRKSSLPNSIFYVPSVMAFASLGLPLTTVTTFMSLLIWSGIYFWRAPENEDYLGRKK